MKEIIENIWDNRELLNNSESQDAIKSTIKNLDEGKIRIAEKIEEKWIINDWIKKAVILYFPISKMEKSKAGPLEFYDKIPLKDNYKNKNIRVVPHAVARFGSTEIQIGLLTDKIVKLSEHFKKFKKDKHSTLGLTKSVNKRKKLLSYLKRKNTASYQKVIKQLNLRK